MRRILIGSILFLVLIAAIGVWRQKAKTLTYQTQTNEEGEVGVSVTPLLFSKDSSKFNVVLTTHSVDLDYSLKEISFLADDQKNEYEALSWDGGKGGHHLKGNLIFPPLSKNSKIAILKMKGIEGVDRVFRWVVRKE